MKSLLSRYGEVTRVHRRTYACALDIETGVRVFTVRNPAPFESFSRSFQVGLYILRFCVRLAGQPTRCYRCDSDQHQVNDCPHPSSYRRCYRFGQEGHIYRSCPGTSAPADSYSAQVVSRNSDADDDDDENWHVCNTRDLDASENEIPPVVNCEVSASPTIVSSDNAGLYSDITESVIDTASDKDQEDEMQASRISGYNGGRKRVRSSSPNQTTPASRKLKHRREQKQKLKRQEKADVPPNDEQKQDTTSTAAEPGKAWASGEETRYTKMAILSCRCSSCDYEFQSCSCQWERNVYHMMCLPTN